MKTSFRSDAQRYWGWFIVGLVLASSSFLLTGCQTTSGSVSPEEIDTIVSESGSPGVQPDSLRLSAGDAVSITFPGAPSLDGAHKIRRDGKLDLRLVGEVEAAGKSPAELQAELERLYEPHLQANDVLVSVEAAPATIYVSGAVLQPGTLGVEHPITALEAVMLAGGFHPDRANTKKVVVIRRQGEGSTGYVLNMKPALEGKSIPAFYLKPNDIVFVPERLQLF